MLAIQLHIQSMDCCQVDCRPLDRALTATGTVTVPPALVHLEGSKAVAVVNSAGAGIYSARADSNRLQLLATIPGLSLSRSVHV